MRVRVALRVGLTVMVRVRVRARVGITHHLVRPGLGVRVRITGSG